VDSKKEIMKKEMEIYETKVFDLIRTGAVEEYQLRAKEFDNIIKESQPELKRNVKKAKNILLHHYKQMFITNSLSVWTFWLAEAKKSTHEEFDKQFILEKLGLIRNQILEQLINISELIGFQIDERDKQYMIDKMDFLQEQYKHLNIAHANQN
jgi:hypothetical protein